MEGYGETEVGTSIKGGVGGSPEVGRNRFGSYIYNMGKSYKWESRRV